MISQAAPACLLALDCSGASASAAVGRRGVVEAERFAAMERGQAEAILPQVEQVMVEAGLRFGAIDALVTTIGPGSFTGLRIGLAAARGLALALGRPIIALTAFEAFVAGLPADLRGFERIVVAIDSRRGPVFAQTFDAGGTALDRPESVEPEALPVWLPPGRLLVVGDGTAAFQGIEGDRIALRPGRIRAGDLIRAARSAGADILARAPVPLYLRAPDVSPPGAPP
jgi:tRNA threonylcarbamoyladenosine biosynthesis protein TsaB